MDINLTNEEIEKIINRYKNKKIREKQYYHTTLKDSEEFVKRNRARAKAHYENNKENKKEKYNNNKDFLKAKSLYNYYKKKDNLNVFKEKHKSKVDLLHEKGIQV